ncbi:MAG: AI-2E family transporter [Cycloclasticus sp.]|jgi:predicted PurR-regulated permease PerM|nr:AI-2E family transporter [Cycloclasticus sp.]
MIKDNSKYFLIFIAFIGVLYLLSPILMPFLSAALLAYLGDPLADWLESRKWQRSWAVTLVFSVIFVGLTSILIILVPLIEQQFSSLIEKVPAIISWVKETVLPWLQVRLNSYGHVDVDKLQQTLQENIGGAGSIVASVLGSISSSGMAFLSGLANLVLIPVVTFYFLRDWDVMMAHIHDSFPRRVEGRLTSIMQEVDSVLGAFFKGQILVMVSLSVIYYVGLSLVGLEFALLISLLIGLVSFVPYLGLIVGVVLACGASAFQLHDASGILPILIVFAVAQTLESVVLTPILVGDRIGLHPVAVIFAVMAGGQLFGFTGVLLALPVAAVLLVLLRHVNDQYKNSELYKQA